MPPFPLVWRRASCWHHSSFANYQRRPAVYFFLVISTGLSTAALLCLNCLIHGAHRSDRIWFVGMNSDRSQLQTCRTRPPDDATGDSSKAVLPRFSLSNSLRSWFEYEGGSGCVNTRTSLRRSELRERRASVSGNFFTSGCNFIIIYITRHIYLNPSLSQVIESSMSLSCPCQFLAHHNSTWLVNNVCLKREVGKIPTCDIPERSLKGTLDSAALDQCYCRFFLNDNNDLTPTLPSSEAWPKSNWVAGDKTGIKIK